ncbi:uncharacterized protein LOC128209835 [Mya arenaria]|uniref:uncharacterized protein LOC128209835 n=1 Tax=Mya arenaria TaxID=6604 RepID=UPI0022E35DB2|nr:uncharacterized protein LOC128209835 [Mya arenaria]
MKTMTHLWLTWRREDIFEVPLYLVTQKKAREVSKMRDHKHEQRQRGLEAESTQDRRIQELDAGVARIQMEWELFHQEVADLGDRLVGHLQAHLDAFQEQHHGVPVGIQVNLPREFLMDVPLGPTQETSLDCSISEKFCLLS